VTSRRLRSGTLTAARASAAGYGFGASITQSGLRLLLSLAGEGE